MAKSVPARVATSLLEGFHQRREPLDKGHRGVALSGGRPHPGLVSPGRAPQSRLGRDGNGVFGEGTEESQQWAAGMRSIMKEGKVDEALKEVERLPGRSSSRRQAKHELITDLINNRDRVVYPRYRMLGLPDSAEKGTDLTAAPRFCSSILTCST